jgi:hypothetical protein
MTCSALPVGLFDPGSFTVHSTSQHSFITDFKFFDLLLEQFCGYEGKLIMAIAYLTQAACDIDAARREALIRIARQKIKHADIPRMILLQIAKGRDLQPPENACLNELTSYLIEQGMRIRRYEALIWSGRATPAIRETTSKRTLRAKKADRSVSASRQPDFGHLVHQCA